MGWKEEGKESKRNVRKGKGGKKRGRYGRKFKNTKGKYREWRGQVEGMERTGRGNGGDR